MRLLSKYALITVGTVSVALGVVGIFLPILPTTPFLLLSAWCYAKSSKRFHGWLMNHPYVGAYIRNYIEKRGIPLKTKVYTLALLWASITLSALVAVQSLHVRLLLFFIAVCVTVHILKLRTLYPEQAKAETACQD